MGQDPRRLSLTPLDGTGDEDRIQPRPKRLAAEWQYQEGLAGGMGRDRLVQRLDGHVLIGQPHFQRVDALVQCVDITHGGHR